MGKHISLRKMYFISFIGLVLVPILCVFALIVGVTNYNIRNTELENIKTAQKGIAQRLSEEVQNLSLQLTHLLFVNNAEVVSLASQTDTTDPAIRYDASKRLDELFRLATAPKQEIMSAMFYMKDGNRTYLKDEIMLEQKKIKVSSWYKKAMEKKDVVTVGCYDTSKERLTYSQIKRGQLILTAAMAVGEATDRSGRVESVVLFAKSDVSEELKTGRKEHKSVLLDQEGEILFGGQNEQMKKGISAFKEKREGTYRKKVLGQDYTFVISEVPDTQWKILTMVDTDILTAQFRRLLGLMLWIVIAILLLFCCFSYYFLRNILGPVHKIVEGFEQVQNGDLNTHIDAEGQSEIRMMIHSFNEMVRRLKQGVEERDEAQKKKHDAEIRALQSQINPHFLVNSLNSIRFMAQVSRFDGIRKMAEALIRIVSCSFRSNISFYSVKEEMEVLDSFLYLMKIRYSDGFEVTYDIAPDCLEYKIPRLILQPIVENAIVHGLAEKEEIGNLKISLSREKDKLRFEILDDGNGMDQEEIRRIMDFSTRVQNDNTSIGIENVCTRLKINFGDSAGLKFESEKGYYTKAILILPVIEKEEEK